MKETDARQNTFFAASNTGAGFVSYFDEIFGSCRHLYILKGGPGTGKSYFLQRVVKEAEKRGYTVLRYLCSSDPDSLDGIYIEGMDVAIADGTSPHVIEPTLPGAREEILNLGQFWDGEKLQDRHQEIKELANKKHSAYKDALSRLHLAGQCMTQRFALISPYLEKEKMISAARRFVKKREKGQGMILACPMHTYGMKGEAYLSTYAQNAVCALKLTPHYGVEYLYLQEILQLCRETGTEVLWSPHPLCPELPEAIFFSAENILVTAMEREEGKRVGCRRFLTKEVISEAPLLRYLQRTCAVMTAAAEKEFEKMRRYHFALEDIYKETMDFEEKERFTEHFLDTLFPK